MEVFNLSMSIEKTLSHRAWKHRYDKKALRQSLQWQLLTILLSRDERSGDNDNDEEDKIDGVLLATDRK